jgi:site-specific DNA recombinase
MSLQVQEEACREFCADRDIQVARLFSDAGASAKTADRPGFQHMLRYCAKHEAHLTHLVVYKLDRFSRSTEDAAICGGILARSGISLMSATEPVSNDASGKLMKNILSALAEFDNTVKGERSLASMKKLVEHGYWLHKGPLGYKNARTTDKRPILVEDPESGPLVRKVFDAVAAQGLTQKGAIEFAQRIGLRQRNGKPISPQYAEKMLHNPLYCGRIICKQTNGRTVKAAFSPLISEALFDQVQATLDGHGHVPTPHRRNNEVFPLRRLVSCADCRRPLTASFSRSSTGKKYPYYFCQTKGCRKTIVRKEALEAGFVHLLDEMTLQTSATMKLFKEIVTQTWHDRQAGAVMAQVGLAHQIERMEKRKSVLLEKLLDGTINDALYRKKEQELATEISLLKAQKHDADVEELEIGNVLDAAERLLRDARSIWDRLDLDGRQRFVRVLYPDGLAYSKQDGYRTPANSPVSMICGVVTDAENGMAPPRGIEPLFPG